MGSLLFNPRSYAPELVDAESAKLLTSVIEFFESKGQARLKDEYHACNWYADFIEFNRESGMFASVATPASSAQLVAADVARGDGRWDTARINELNEILGFYSLDHWYAWQVTVLGLGPVFSSANEAARALVATQLAEGHIFGFGLSEQHHGADIYSTDMIVSRTEDGAWRANGPKYYIGNGNLAGRLAVFGRFADDDPDMPGEYVFFLVDPRHSKYRLEKNVVHGSMYVAAFSLEDYPVGKDDILHTGKAAWDAALASVNIGKVNLGWASIGICEHSFYEAIHHAHNRILYGNRVTDFTHVRRLFADAYSRLLAMKLYAARSADYFRCAGPDDRRYLLFNPITKLKVTSEGERVIDHLWDVIAARGFEKDMYFEQAVSHIRALPKLEGTVHVNLALVLKFLPQYLAAANGHPGDYEPVPVRQDMADDAYLFEQGRASGLGSIQFHNPMPAFERFAHLPNVKIFMGQAQRFGQLVATQPPNEEQIKDLDFLLNIGQLFTQVVYAQLVCEAAAAAIDGQPGGTRTSSVSDFTDLTEGHVDRIFRTFVHDINEFALALHDSAAANDDQQAAALGLIEKAATSSEQDEWFHAEIVAYDGSCELNP